MSNFRKAALRVVALSALVLGTISLMQPADAYAFSCIGNCFTQRKACNTACNGDPVCISDCTSAYQSCACSCSPINCN